MRRLLVLLCGLVLGSVVCPAVASAAPSRPGGVASGAVRAGEVARSVPSAPRLPAEGASAAAVAAPVNAHSVSAQAGIPVPVPVSGAVVVTGAPVAGGRADLDGAFARRGANACSWTVGSPGIEKTFTFDAAAGTYELTSFRNTLVVPARQYIAPGVVSAEFRFTWDGVTLTGASGGWSCSSGKVSKVDAGGAAALQLDVSLSRPSAGVAVTKHYVIFPAVALVRQWADYANSDSVAHELARPSFLEQRVMGDAAADTDLSYMLGSASYELQTVPLTADYSQVFDSYNAYGGFLETSQQYEPWFSLFDRATHDGIYLGFDYFGRWAMSARVQDDTGTSLSLAMPNYDAPLAPGASVTSPKAFDAVYKTDLDDMTNRILAWQYTYMWDYTRTPYFGAVRNEGQLLNVGIGDPSGQLQQVFNLIDNLSTTGVDDYHRDSHWWYRPQGDWDGPDWRITNNYLSKFGMTQTIYYYAYNAVAESKIAQAHPEWFLDSPCSYGGGLADLRIPAARAWMVGLLAGNAQRWGDYEWRNDSCPMGDFPGDQQLGQDQGFRAVLQQFLDQRPGSGFHGVDTGGMEFGYDFLRFADGTSFTDGPPTGIPQQDGGSRLYPVDKLSGVPEGWRADGSSDIGSCDARFYNQLIFSPDVQGYTSNPAALECLRKVVDIYHYLLAQGVAGRWVRQYHPHATDVDASWFERLSWDGRRGLIVYKGDASPSAVTVYPKGLDPRRSYDVRFQFTAGSSRRSGADLMASGITLPSMKIGELVYLNLPGHPGAGTDHVAPAAPEHVTATAGTQMDTSGVEVSWTPGTDNNWVSYYQVSRDGRVIGKTAKGTFYFDHTPAASPAAVYTVRTVDGDGNMSPAAASGGGGPGVTFADDSSPGITYSFGWSHLGGVPGPFAGTQSAAHGGLCGSGCQGFSGVQGQGGWGYQDGPEPPCLQACQQFSGVQGQGGWSYQELSAPVPPSCHMACLGFSGTQGANGWSYQTLIGGAWSDIVSYHEPFGLVGECCAWFDFSDGFSGLVTPRLIVGGAGQDTARAWTAPKDGVIDITAQAIPVLGGSQAVLTVTRNGQPVWGPRALDGSTAALDTSVANVSVSVGDVIRFEVQGAAEVSLQNLVQWDPDIAYQGDPPPPPPPPFADMSSFHAGEDFTGDGPFWHDAGGYVSARLAQPGGDRDVARAWTAPADGVVDITGHVADLGLSATAVLASSASITDNGVVIWGPEAIGVGDTTGVDAAVPAVAVSAGDVIRFVVAAGGQTLAWDPDVTYQGDQPVVSPPPVWADMAAFHPADDFGSDGPFWHDNLGYVSARLLQSSLRRDVARTWTARRDGTVDITGHASGASAMVSITRNGEVVWGPQPAGETDTDVPGVAVSAGDVIRFQVAAGVGAGSPVRWDPDISYQDGPPVVDQVASASWTFTGSQVSWYAELGPDHGMAQVLIDGQPDATVSLFGPSAGDWSIPVYVKTFPVAGTHTITVEAPAELGTATVDVDGFQAVTASPAVTQDTSSKVGYVGSGWAAQSSGQASGGSVTASSTAGDAVSFSFTGRSVTWVGRTCSACGEADVYLDGAYVTRIDTYGYRGLEVWQAGLFQHSWARPGKHTLKIVADGTANILATGTEVDIDSFHVGTG